MAGKLSILNWIDCTGRQQAGGHDSATWHCSALGGGGGAAVLPVAARPLGQPLGVSARTVVVEILLS